MGMMKRWKMALAMLLIILGVQFLRGPSEADEAMAPEVFGRMVEVLSGRKVAHQPPAPELTLKAAAPSLRQLYKRTVRSVPFVITNSGTGSAAVFALNRERTRAFVVTNSHVVRRPFRNPKGIPFVLLLFYQKQLAGEVFDERRLAACFQSSFEGEWCRLFRRSLRAGIIIANDPDRDLALLMVPEPPRGVEPIDRVNLKRVEPGDDVAVIGHPGPFLWSLTRGIVSAIRHEFPMGETYLTVIQTQAPIGPGNSGGPLLTLRGQLIGVITLMGRETQALNLAIGINEIQSFATKEIEQRR